MEKHTNKPAKTKLPKLHKIKPVHMRFAAAYAANGGNASQAYIQATAGTDLQAKEPAKMGHKWTNRDDVRLAIQHHMQLYGADVDAVSRRVASMIASTDPWVADRGVTHSRAILGLDAPAQSHVQVDKRTVNVTVTGEAAASLLKDLLSKSKP